MAEETKFPITSGFFDSINHDRTYSADTMNRPYKRLISEGIFATPEGTASTDLQVLSRESGMSIVIKKGEGLLGGKWFDNSTDIIFDVPSNTNINNRIDSVIIQVDKRQDGRACNVIYRQGMPDLKPKAPELSKEVDIIEKRVANIQVDVGVTQITNANITDLRGAGDPESCPWITHLIYQVDTSQLYTQWQSAYEQYYNKTEKDTTKYFNEEKEKFDNYYNTKDAEMSDYISDKQGQIDNYYNQTREEMNSYLEEKKNQINTYYTTTEQETEQYIEEQKKKFNDYYTNTDQQMNEYMTKEKQDLSNFITDQKETMNDYITSEKEKFEEFLSGVTDHLTVSTNLITFESHYDTIAEGETQIPIQIPSYNKTSDVLYVFINGLRVSPNDYTVDDTSQNITLTQALDINQPVDFFVLQSFLIADPETAITKIKELDKKIEPLLNDTGWTDLMLASGVMSYNDEMKPSIRRNGNHIYIKGAIKGLTETGKSICTLTENLRPITNHQFLSASYTGESITATVIFDISPEGEIKIVAKSGDISADDCLPIATNYIMTE